MESLTQIIIRARSISSDAWDLNVEATPYEDQEPIIEARRQCLAAYDDALQASSPREAHIHLQIARDLEDEWNTADEASIALSDPMFDPMPLSSRSRMALALEVDFL
jgi:hypothetical protein